LAKTRTLLLGLYHVAVCETYLPDIRSAFKRTALVIGRRNNAADGCRLMFKLTR